MKYILCILVAAVYIFLGYKLMCRLDAFLDELRASQENETRKTLPRVGLEQRSDAPAAMEQIEEGLAHTDICLLRAPAPELMQELKEGNLDVVVLSSLPAVPFEENQVAPTDPHDL